MQFTVLANVIVKLCTVYKSRLYFQTISAGYVSDEMLQVSSTETRSITIMPTQGSLLASRTILLAKQSIVMVYHQETDRKHQRVSGSFAEVLLGIIHVCLMQEYLGFI